MKGNPLSEPLQESSEWNKVATVNPARPVESLEKPKRLLPDKPALRALNRVAKVLEALTEVERQWVVEAAVNLYYPEAKP